MTPCRMWNRDRDSDFITDDCFRPAAFVADRKAVVFNRDYRILEGV